MFHLAFKEIQIVVVMLAGPRILYQLSYSLIHLNYYADTWVELSM